MCIPAVLILAEAMQSRLWSLIQVDWTELASTRRRLTLCRSDAAGYANQSSWRGPAHVERWLRVMQTFSGSASDATIVTPAEAQHYAIGGVEAWLPVAGALRCLEAQSLGGALGARMLMVCAGGREQCG